MKIGIITQPLSRNYGGILQNYALQQTLIKLGHMPYTFDLGKFTWLDWSITTIKGIIKKIIGRPYIFLEFPTTRRHKESVLRQFVKKHIALVSPRVKRPSVKKVKEYDMHALVVGSDQVWRPIYNYNIYDMYLGFVQNLDIKRIAYGASFGTDNWEYDKEQTEKCKILAQQFDAISVRENSAADLCNKYLGVEAVPVLDPTLLLKAEEYNKLLINIPSRQEKILFAYLLDISDEKIEYVRTIANTMGLTPIIKSAGGQLSDDDSIEKWLAYFRDAKYIITDSFHGTVFSIIYNKLFIVTGNEGRGMARFTSLLKLFSLEKRMITDFGDTDIWREQIDWMHVNDMLLQLQQTSTAFLSKSLS